MTKAVPIKPLLPNTNIPSASIYIYTYIHQQYSQHSKSVKEKSIIRSYILIILPLDKEVVNVKTFNSKKTRRRDLKEAPNYITRCRSEFL